MKETHLADRIFGWCLRFFALASMALLLGIVVMLFQQAWPILSQDGLSFFLSKEWNPVTEEFGALVFIYGTAITSLLALLLATPLSIAVALFLTDVSRGWISKIISVLVEMLAAVPSVVYGLWGIFVLAPLIRDYVQEPLANSWGDHWLFSGPPLGIGVLSASIILAIMITPTITSVCREIFNSIGRNQREASLALGSTRWEMMRISVLTSSKTGIFGAVTLGLGRAFGETMAVTMVIGNRNEIATSLMAPAQTMASLIANEFGEAVSSLHLAALSGVGLVLLLISLVINLIARWMVRNEVRV